MLLSIIIHFSHAAIYNNNETISSKSAETFISGFLYEVGERGLPYMEDMFVRLQPSISTKTTGQIFLKLDTTGLLLNVVT
jgi:hypothetical protein